MNKSRYGLVLLMAVVAGLIGGAVSSQLGQKGLFPQLLLPRNVQVRREFEIVDNQGERRVVLDKAGLTFFGEDGELPTLNVQGSYLKLHHRGTNTSVELNPSGSYVLCFTERTAPRTGIIEFRNPCWRPPVAPPKLGAYVRDGKVLWEVP